MTAVGDRVDLSVGTDRGRGELVARPDSEAPDSGEDTVRWNRVVGDELRVGNAGAAALFGRVNRPEQSRPGGRTVGRDHHRGRTEAPDLVRHRGLQAQGRFSVSVCAVLVGIERTTGTE